MEQCRNTKEEREGGGWCMKITRACYQVSIRPPYLVLSDLHTARCWLILIIC